MSAPFHSIAKDPASQPDQADREVVEYVNSWFRVGATAHELRDSLGLVLLAVVSAASTLALFIEITKVSRLYSEHRGQLDPLLSQAWEKKSFETIRKISLFHKRIPFSLTQLFVQAQMEATEQSWMFPFQGDAHLKLRDTIVHMNKERTPTQAYANMMTIIQSSGTGKSRLVDKLAEVVFTLPFNLRDPKENESGAFPLPDTEVYELLVGSTLGDTKYDVGARYCAFLITLFEKAQSILPSLEKSKPVAQSWRDYVVDLPNRRKLYTDVVASYGLIFEEFEKEVARREQVESKPSRTPATSATRMVPTVLSIVAAERMTTAAKEFQRKIDTLSSPAPALIILYFDESHSLHKVLPRDLKGATRYAALCWALDTLRSTQMFTLFLSTNSNLSAYAPPRTRGRISALEDNVQPLYTALSFDCHPGFPVNAAALSLKDTSKISFLCRFGRPLFWTRYEMGGTHVRQQMVQFAKTKLAWNAKDKELAVLDVRLLLDYEHSAEAWLREEELVESGMRIAYSVPQHRRYMYSGYPSEPILAEAAASVWADIQREGGYIPAILERYINAGLIRKDERGELVARLLLLLAFDAAVQRAGGELYTTEVKLIDFLRELFGDHHYDNTIAKSKPSAGQIPFDEAFKDAYVRFTHFGRNRNATLANTKGASAAILRSMAIQCHSGQEMIDIIIPVALKTQGLQEENMSAVKISIKDRRVRSTKAKVDIRASKISFFPTNQVKYGGTEHGRPYVALILELGTEPTTRKPPVNREAKISAEMMEVDEVDDPDEIELSDKDLQLGTVIAKPPPTRQSTRNTADQPIVNPCYTMYAYGCTSYVYKVVKNENVFSSLLGSRMLFGEESIQRLKPVWEDSEACLDWYG